MKKFKLIEVFHGCKSVDECLVAGRTYAALFHEGALNNLKFGYAKGGYFSAGGKNEKYWSKAIEILEKELKS